MEARIDYLRFWLPYEVQERVDLMNRLEGIAYDVLKQHNIPGKPYGRTTYYSRSKKRVESTWQVWGVAADLFLRELPADLLKLITRIDHRAQFTNHELDFDSLFNMLKEKHKGRMNVHQISSPQRRTKGPQRDTGGEGIIIGAPESKRRLTVYKRAQEGPHIECQFSGDDAQRIMTNAFHNGVMLADTIYDSVFQASEHFFGLLVRERVGMTPNELDAYAQEFSDRIAFTDPEYVLYKMDSLFDLLPPDGQEAIFESIATKMGLTDETNIIITEPPPADEPQVKPWGELSDEERQHYYDLMESEYNDLDYYPDDLRDALEN